MSRGAQSPAINFFSDCRRDLSAKVVFPKCKNLSYFFFEIFSSSGSPVVVVGEVIVVHTSHLQSHKC